MWSVTLLLLLVALGWLHRRTKRAGFVAKVDRIPGPPKWPILGNTLEFLRSPSALFTWVTRDLAALGPVVRVWVLGEAQVVITGARDAELVLKGHAHLDKSPSYRFLHDWLGLALLVSGGDRWRVYRKMLNPAFHFGVLAEFMPVFNKNAMRLMKRLAEEPRAKQGFDIFQHASLCALDVICESSMGAEINAQENQDSPYVFAVNSIMDLVVHRYFSAVLRNDFLYKFSQTKKDFEKHLKTIDEFADKVIAERREYLQSLKSEDEIEKTESDSVRRHPVFVDLLLAAEDSQTCPEYLTQKDIRGNVNAFTFAGYDTVTTSMSWTLFLLGTYPEYQAQVVEELEQVFGASGRAPTMSDLAELKVLERCIRESLRLYPSGPFFERIIEQDVQLEKYVVPAGCTATFSLYSLHRDPEIFPDPDKFDPDRFLPENCVGRSAFAYMPFSAGPRICIGQRFALLEEKAVLSSVLRRFRIEAAHRRDEAILRVGIILRPENGLHIRIFDRDSHPHLRITGS